MAIHHLCIISLGIAGAVAATAAVAANSKPGLVFSSPTEAVRGVHEGATVLWGGIIFARQDETTQHCVAVVSYPLERKNGRPITTAPLGQVFYACSNAALEWGDYAVGRQLAVAGTTIVVLKRKFYRPIVRQAEWPPLGIIESGLGKFEATGFRKITLSKTKSKIF